jgi:ribosomal protein S18 acetylase RimI-like enzyme
MNWAFSQGATVLSLRVRTSNSRAIALYERNGFEEVERIEVGATPMLVMERCLAYAIGTPS